MTKESLVGKDRTAGVASRKDVLLVMLLKQGLMGD